MAKIEDFGERIDGAAKDRWRAWAARLEAAGHLDPASEPLSRLFPEPPYEKLLEEGADAWSLAFVHAVRDAIPAKPKGWKLPSWQRQVEDLRALASSVLSGRVPRERIEAKLAEPSRARLAARISSSLDLYLAVGHAQSLKGYRVEEASYAVLDGRRCDPPLRRWEVQKEKPKTVFSNMPEVLAHAGTRAGAIAAFRDAFRPETEVRTKRDTKFVLYGKRREPGTWIGKRIGRNMLDLEHFPTTSEARAYLRDHADRLEEKLARLKDVPAERREGNRDRVGPDRRDGKPVTPEAFLETFGFRGVQFGNYVEASRRQADLDDAHDALLDLAETIGCEPRALSLGGELGLAFGARGRGGIGAGAAHYEPIEIVINLTKTRGAGSLAHEWFHALDNHVARLAGRPMSYATSSPAAGDPAARAMRSLSDLLTGLPMLERSKRLDETRSTPYWSERIEIAARAFEAHVIARLAEGHRSNDYLANVVEEEVFEAEARLKGQPAGRYPYPSLEEIDQVSAAFDGMLSDPGMTRILGDVAPRAPRLGPEPEARPPRTPLRPRDSVGARSVAEAPDLSRGEAPPPADPHEGLDEEPEIWI
jgi:hypothetical protein